MGIYAQEENKIDVAESAAVFLEEYSDDFQENFFEALKQKGIENYDKAVNLLLKSKQLEPDNDVVDYELAKAYLADKQALFAQDYAVSAVSKVPENPWYLQTLVEILKKQNLSITEVETDIPLDNIKLQENLALIYYKNGEYTESLKILNGIKNSTFANGLIIKVNDAEKRRAKSFTTTSFSTTVINRSDNPAEDALIGYKARIKGLIMGKSYLLLEQIAKEALESYPSYPYFYYAYGLALNNKGKYRDAIEVLESGADFLVGNIATANKLYTELVTAYKGINNTTKANMYLRKIRPGF